MSLDGIRIHVYMVKGWGSEGFLIYKAFNEVKGVEHAPGGLFKPPWLR